MIGLAFTWTRVGILAAVCVPVGFAVAVFLGLGAHDEGERE